ncbi:MAG: hypothetical protein LBI19_06615 [Oscillospiraceae bacterium]|nr:hypothetical protein [Oscillospiraceae bacterium]
MKEHLKTALLILLGLSALYLLGRTWMYESGLFGAANPEPEIYAPARPDYAPAAVSPARCAVTRGGERMGGQYDAETGEVYEAFKSMLAQALGLAGEAVPVPAGDALRLLLLRDGVYFEFSGQIPMPLLAAWLSADTSLGGDIEVVGLAFGGEGAELFWADADGAFYTAAVPIGEPQWPELPELRPCAFAFEEEYAAALVSWQLLIEETEPRVSVMASAPPDIQRELPLYAPFLSKLGLSSSSTTSYLRDGVRVYMDVENGQSCEISPDGAFLFSNPGAPAIGGAQTLAGDVLRAWEAVSLLEPAMGGARFEVFRAARTDGGTAVELALTVNGVPLLWESAFVEVEGGVARRISLKLCRVTIGEDGTLPLPLRQAAVLVDKSGMARLDLRYAAGDGGDLVWAVRS